MKTADVIRTDKYDEKDTDAGLYTRRKNRQHISHSTSDQHLLSNYDKELCIHV